MKDGQGALFFNFFKFVGLEVVCSSWSIARRGCPPPLRDNGKGLMGLPGLSPADARKVRVGNQQYRCLVRIIKACILLGIGGYVENPRTSRIWRTWGVKTLLRKGAFFVDTDLCQFGTPYRKATRILFCGFEQSAFADFPRCFANDGRCSKSVHRHVRLSGTDGGIFRTKAAQVYPVDFARFLTQALTSATLLKVQK